ncbi:hypothetical protein [Leptothoe sp. PORK10 BA2]|uniref:hypothetical protein n=1 Tax=Leptothoe sp. PORK10 BA2 TaxID=3110254 RepID=UPI002B205359|nr:hypothetical protein [Leptothoe sp. PORK10 BA2]MEA5466971.1 hypothetical protein [Leptothoe sp. PORK10 BA2]
MAAVSKQRSASLHSNKQGAGFVKEQNPFLALWPHRFDYLFAPHPDPGTKPEWQTESRHPLSDRLIVQGAYLYGVRPGSTTYYGLLDIDRGSPYHPQRDPLALTRISEALEPLGLVTCLKLTSSDSMGLHIYFPFAEEVPSWQLALAVATLLENAGFKLMPGWLEIFPNRKPFSPDGSYSLFNGHRLPLQQGSYLLNDDLQPIASSHLAFVRQWQAATARNDISIEVLEQTVRQAKRKAYRVSGKAEKFLNDLNAEIEPGWSGPGQTNHILGRITMRSYIFGHVLGAEGPLNGKALIDEIVKVAKALPGFKDYCGHQRDLRKKAKAWAHSIENKSHYFPYASGKAFKAKQGPTWNEQQAAEAREHIRQCVIELCKQNAFPDGTTPRYDVLCACHISGATLYKNQDLWHPNYISDIQKTFVEHPPHPPIPPSRAGATCAAGAKAPAKDTSLLGAVGCNKPNDKGSSDSVEGKSEQLPAAGCNKPSDAAFSAIEAVRGAQQVERSAPPEQLSLNIQWALQIARSKHREQVEANKKQYRQERGQRSQSEYKAQLQEWINSGDPVLVAEAERVLNRIEQATRAM